MRQESIELEKPVQENCVLSVAATSRRRVQLHNLISKSFYENYTVRQQECCGLYCILLLWACECKINTAIGQITQYIARNQSNFDATLYSNNKLGLFWYFWCNVLYFIEVSWIINMLHTNIQVWNRMTKKVRFICEGNTSCSRKDERDLFFGLKVICKKDTGYLLKEVFIVLVIERGLSERHKNILTRISHASSSRSLFVSW